MAFIKASAKHGLLSFTGFVYFFFIYFLFFVSFAVLQRSMAKVHWPPWISLLANFMGTSYICFLKLSIGHQIIPKSLYMPSRIFYVKSV